MGIRILAGNAHPQLAAAIADALAVEFEACVVERFPDGESHVCVPDTLAGDRVAVVQPLGPPVNDHLVELLLLMDAAHRAGAAEIVAVVPYVGYARQDRREPGEAVGIRVVADAVASRGPPRLIVVDPHITSLEAVMGISVDYVSGADALTSALRDGDGPRILVAPDLGAAKLVQRYARALDLPTAVVRKRRLSGMEVEAGELIGDVAGRAPIIVDDMLSTGGTIEAAARLLLQHGAQARITVAATHGLFVGPAVERLGSLPIERIVVTDTLPPPAVAQSLPLEVVSVARPLADAVARLRGS
jgi:ribose-phosphate pyrophosphokinase